MSGSGQDTMVSSEVEVAVDPDTAFAAFTEELDLWWVRGPINHFAGGRALAVRCEPGVGFSSSTLMTSLLRHCFRDGLDRHEVGDPCDHPSDLGTVGQGVRLADAP